MTGCEEFETAIEMRKRGALSAPLAEALESHLAGRASCRAYQALVERTEGAMAMTTAETLKGFDWQALEANVGRVARRLRWEAPLRVVLLAALFPAIVLLTMVPSVRPLGGGIGLGLGLFLAVQIFLERRRFRRESEEAAKSREDLLAFWRTDLDRRIQRLRAWPVQFVASAGVLVPVLTDRQHQLPVAGAYLAGALAALMTGQGLYWGVWKLPRLRRERHELGK